MQSQLPEVCGPLGYRDTVLRAPTGLSMARRAAGNLSPPNVTGLSFFLISDRLKTVAGAHSGTGDSFSAVVTSAQTLTDAAGLFTTDDAGRRLNIAGSGAGNNGNFYARDLGAAPAATTLRFNRPVAGGAVEAVYPGTWTLGNKFSQLVDLKSARVFSNAVIATQLAEITEFTSPTGAAYSCLGTGGPTTGGVTHSLLTCSDAAMSGFTSVDVSFSARIRLMTSAAAVYLIGEFYDSANPTTSRIVFQTNTGRNLQFLWTGPGPGGTTQVTSTFGALSFDVWYTVGFRLNRGAANCTWFLDGVNMETGATMALKVPVIDRFGIGDKTGGGVAPAFASALAAAPAAWSDAEFLAVHNSFLTYKTPT